MQALRSSCRAPSLLFCRGFGSVSAIFRNEPRCAVVGSCKTNCQSSLPSRCGFRSFCSGNEIEMKKGDWMCPVCNFHNFAKNIRCLKCKAEGPIKVVDYAKLRMKPGDWICPQCQFKNFARNKSCCLRCREPNPEREMRPGDWKCPICAFPNFRKNMSCLRCGKEQTEEAEFIC